MIEWQLLEGLQEYNSTVALMERYVAEIIDKKRNDIVLLLEHSPVITGGTSANIKDLITEDATPIIYTGRGGKFTYHGPGQRVIYPIINLNYAPWQRDLKFYINFLQNCIIDTLQELNINAFLHSEHVGIWVIKGHTPAKVAALGVRARKWVTFHGLAINVKPDLQSFTSFVPCGISNLGVTSLEELGCNIDIAEFDEIFKKRWNIAFNLLVL